jgi:hypothetical protein
MQCIGVLLCGLAGLCSAYSEHVSEYSAGNVGWMRLREGASEPADLPTPPTPSAAASYCFGGWSRLTLLSRGQQVIWEQATR